jgi:hypothetical protein
MKTAVRASRLKDRDGRFETFAKPSANGRHWHRAAFHRVVLARLQRLDDHAIGY